MSQRIVFEIIQSFEDGASTQQIKNRIEEEYPDRSLSQYLNIRLKALLKKGAVHSKVDDQTEIYYTPKNSKLSPESLGAAIEDLEAEVDEDKLEMSGIEIVNIVASGAIGQDIYLQRLAMDILDVEYEPETSPLAVWRPFKENSVTVLIPASGKITIIGSASREELSSAVNKIMLVIPDFCTGEINEEFEKDIEIHNVVGSTELGRELDLAEVAVGLGLENVEYDPEQFPGLVYRPTGTIVVLLFRSGKMVITASNTYEMVLRGYKETRQALQDIGVKFAQ